MVDNRKRYEPPRVRDVAAIASKPIEPDDVCRLLNTIELATGPVAVPPELLQELVIVWLRVAALHERIEQNPGLHEPAELCAVKTLLFGRCEHSAAAGFEAEHDTEPNNEKPEPLQ